MGSLPYGPPPRDPQRGARGLRPLAKGASVAALKREVGSGHAGVYRGGETLVSLTGGGF